MLADISQQLITLEEKRKREEKLQRDLAETQKRLKESEKETDALRAKLRNEMVDVRKLEKLTLRSLFQTMLGSREEQLEKERQELLRAQLAYQKSKKLAEHLKEDRKAIRRELAELGNLDEQHSQLLAEKEAALQSSGSPVAQSIRDLSFEMATLQSEKKELQEAIQAGRKVIDGLDQTAHALSSAKNWGVWDMLGGGMISTAVKHDYIEDARLGAEQVQADLARFHRELVDVGNQQQLVVELEPFERFADWFMDGILFDWLVQAKINQSYDQVYRVMDHAKAVVTKLEKRLSAVNLDLENLEQKRRTLILQG